MVAVTDAPFSHRSTDSRWLLSSDGCTSTMLQITRYYHSPGPHSAVPHCIVLGHRPSGRVFVWLDSGFAEARDVRRPTVRFGCPNSKIRLIAYTSELDRLLRPERSLLLPLLHAKTRGKLVLPKACSREIDIRRLLRPHMQIHREVYSPSPRDLNRSNHSWRLPVATKH